MSIRCALCFFSHLLLSTFYGSAILWMVEMQVWLTGSPLAVRRTTTSDNFLIIIFILYTAFSKTRKCKCTYHISIPWVCGNHMSASLSSAELRV